MEKPNATPQHIIIVVVWTIAVLSSFYIGTLAYRTILETASAELLSAFTHAGDTLLGALIGLLINTRTSENKKDQPELPVGTVEPSVDETETSKPLPTV